MADETQPPPDAPLVPPPAPAAPPSPESAPAIFEGSVSAWIGLKTFTFSVLLMAAGIGVAVYGTTNNPGGYGASMQIGGVALLLASSLMTAYVILQIKCQRYKITRRLIEREQGILFKRVDALDLGRIRDVQLSQSLFERAVNIGTIEIFSSDRTDPVMLIEAIPNARPIYEQLRDAVIAISQRRGVMPMG